MGKIRTQGRASQLSDYAQDRVARIMYMRGSHFAGAALLVRRQGGYEYVVLHLLCQGIEIILKALLLLQDYTNYQPRLKKFGHELPPLADAVAAAYGVPPMRPALRQELEKLNTLYVHQHLRYGSAVDFFIDPATIPHSLVLRRLLALVRLCNRRLS